MQVRQPKGKKHAKLIKRRAMRLWKASHFQKNLWRHCLVTAIEDHRKKVEAEIISKQVAQQLSFEPHQCDNNGWIG